MSHFYMTGAHRRRDARDEVWHQSATAQYFDADAVLTVAEAMGLAGIYDMTMTTTELFPYGSDEPLPGRFVLTLEDAPWSPDESIYTRRIVGNRYQPMQNWRLAEIMEGLATHWPIEGTMVLKKGEIVIVQLKIDEYAVGNQNQEQHYSYLTVANDHIEGGLIWLKTVIRAECWNTYSASLSSLDKIRVPHSINTDTTIAFISKVEEATVQAQKDEREVLNSLFNRQINKDELADIVDAAFPAPKGTKRMEIAALPAAQAVEGHLATAFFDLVDKDQKNIDWKEERQVRFREEVGSAYSRFNDAHEYAANTAYAAFNAVTEVVNHSTLYTGGKDKQMISLMFGDKAKVQQKAYAAAKNLL